MGSLNSTKIYESQLGLNGALMVIQLMGPLMVVQLWPLIVIQLGGAPNSDSVGALMA